MFAGIIRQQAEIVRLRDDGVGRRFWIRVSPRVHLRLSRGNSIALDGVCFTVSKKHLRSFEIEAMPQTLRITTVGRWKAGDRLNMESSLRLGDVIGGHLIYGHVDEVGMVVQRALEGTAAVITFEVSSELANKLSSRASIAIDGVSLTVMDIFDCHFRVSLLPDTLTATTLDRLKPGDKVNIELDMLLRYAYQQLQQH